MTAPAGLLKASEQLKPEPAVFVRVVPAPPGFPWEQARAAALEARAGAPLPIAEVVFRLRRLDPWRPGAPARFAACYVRAQEAAETFEARVQVEGRSFTLRFTSSRDRDQRARRLGAIAAIAGVTSLLFGLALSTAISVRGDVEARLAAAELSSGHRLRVAKTQDRIYRESRLLETTSGPHRAVRDVLGDLAWLARSKAPTAHIDAVHWEQGYMAVEVRGDAAPFPNADRQVLKSQKPVRPGVWLWGVGPAGSAPGQAANATDGAVR
jgi:hypothetical protein